MPRKQIFISHKHEDYDIAKMLGHVLRHELAGLAQIPNGEEMYHELGRALEVDVFLSEDIPTGSNWRGRIEDALQTSDLMILLYTHADMNWNWCFYEAGLYTDLSTVERERKKILVINNGIDQPGPTEHIQSINCTIEAISDFLVAFFRGSPDYFGERVAVLPEIVNRPTYVRAIAEHLCTEFSKKAKSAHVIHDYISLSIAREDLEEGRIPLRTRIGAEQDTLRTLFGVTTTSPTWGHIRKSFQNAQQNTIGDPYAYDADFRWMDELANELAAIKAGQRPKPLSNFRSPVAAQGRLWRPLIQRVDLFGEHELSEYDHEKGWYTTADRIEIFLQFVEARLGFLENMPDNPQGYLVSALSMARRFRYEVIGRFYGNIHWPVSDERYRRSIRELKQSMEIVLRDADLLNLATPDHLLPAFDTEEDRQELLVVYGDWLKHREIIFRKIEELEALPADRRNEVNEFLENMAELTFRFMILATRRWNEILRSEFQAIDVRRSQSAGDGSNVVGFAD